ncbi:MAG TPA: cytochrome c maturation protein CcmE [Mycobacteriales bacterium]|nr:cytochrome c maturation protein CcmE [Mycobacteriales bacterium]
MSQVAGDGPPIDDGLMPDDFLPEDFRAEPVPRRRGLRPAQWRIVACLAVVVAALGWVAIKGLTGNLVYYLTPTDISHHKADVGQRIRLGGFVVPGSVGRAGELLKFTVTDGTRSMTVVDTGSVPELFKAGQGVVVEGSLGRDGRFHSDTLLIKHNGDYQPPKPGEKPPNSADLSQGG